MRNNTSLGFANRNNNPFRTQSSNFKSYTLKDIKLNPAAKRIYDEARNNLRTVQVSPRNLNENMLNDITGRLMKIADTYNKALYERKASIDSKYY